MEGAPEGGADGVASGGTEDGDPAVVGVARTGAGSRAGRAGPVDEAEGDGVAESRVERAEEAGVLNPECRAVNASQTREIDIAVPIPTVTVPMSSAGDCFRLLGERRADLWVAGAGRGGGGGGDGNEDGEESEGGEGNEDGEGVPGGGAFSSKSSISAGRAPWPSRQEADTFPKTRSSPEGARSCADCGAHSLSGVRDVNC
ncbi:hypothetical protein GCM10010433_72840 [Streptomyces pulveraceus]